MFSGFPFFHCFRCHQALHSFPTRRSSDLSPRRTFLPDSLVLHDDAADELSDIRRCKEDFPVRPMSLSSSRSEEHTSELQSPYEIVCSLPLEKKKSNRSPGAISWFHEHTAA